MSSPLGLNVALSRGAHGHRVAGVCELPRTTAQRVAALLEASAGLRFSAHSHAGLNHQSWLYAFRDDLERDITAQVLAALPPRADLGVTTGKIRELGAVPVHYLRMFFHARRVTAEQQHARVRGRVLAHWSQQVERALCATGGPDTPQVDRLLARRRMDWFDEGVVPVLAALLQPREVSFPLNVPAGAAMPGAAADAIVEIDCSVSNIGIRARPVPPLPAGPAALTRALLCFERAALDLPRDPTTSMLADVLAEHPLTPRGKIRLLARALADVRAETL
jgi:alpha-galactosidase/6-phospho-beta-glucosidase family protein